MKKKESLILGRIFSKLAARLGAKVMLEPRWGIAGQLTFKNGKRSYFRYNTVDLNPVGASEIAKDKDYANFFMRKLGYPIVPGSRVFYSDKWSEAVGVKNQKIDDAYRYAVRLGFPVVVKPNSGSQGSRVALVHRKKEFYSALRDIFRYDKIALVQKYLTGNDYRLVVLDNRVISAYQRIPLCVIGDGKSSILDLIKSKQKIFDACCRDTRIRPNDPRIKGKLKQQKLDFGSVPARGKTIYLLDNANLSTGGESIDVTSLVHPRFKKIAISLTKDMGLRLCGVDLIIDGDISDGRCQYWVLEINASPGLDHYAKTGAQQRRLVEDMYFKVLKSIGK